MTQYPKRKFRPETLLLVFAALVFGAVVGLGLTRSGTVDVPVAVASLPAGSIDQLEALALTNPKDSGTLQKLGQAYFDKNSYDQAVEAYRKAAEAEPTRAVLWSSLGEARVMASQNEPMPADALANFRRALELDPKDPRGRYFAAVKQDLDGDHKGAIDSWLALLADTPTGAPWEADLKRTISQVGTINRIEVTQRIAAIKQPGPPSSEAFSGARGIPGPSAEDIRNAATMRPSEQQKMAEGMVASLESKLRANPGNIDGWVMLMRSRMTLGQPDKATAALKDAIAANPGVAARLKQEAQGLGIR